VTAPEAHGRGKQRGEEVGELAPERGAGDSRRATAATAVAVAPSSSAASVIVAVAVKILL